MNSLTGAQQHVGVAKPVRAARLPLVVLLLSIIIAVTIRAVGLGSRALWLDEGHSLEPVWTLGDSIWNVCRDGNKPPLYFYLLHGWTVAFGYSESAVRALSLAFGLGSVLVVFAMLRRYAGWTAASTAALICACAPLEIVYAQQTRYYTMLGLLVSLACWAGVNALQAPSLRRWLYWGLAALALLYTHSTGVVLVFALGVASLASTFFLPERARNLSYLALTSTLVALLSLPWYLHSMDIVGNHDALYTWMQNIWPGAPPLSAPLDTVLNLTSGSGRRMLHRMSASNNWSVLLSVVIVIPWLLLYVPSPQLRLQALSKQTLLLSAYLSVVVVVTLVGLWTWSQIFFNVYLPGRADVAIGPLLCALVAIGIGRIPFRRLAWLLTVLLAVAMLVNVSLRYHCSSDETGWGNDRRAGRLVADKLSVGDQLILAGPFAPTLAYYVKRFAADVEQWRYPPHYLESPYLSNTALSTQRFEAVFAEMLVNLDSKHGPRRIALVLADKPIHPVVLQQQQQLVARLVQHYGPIAQSSVLFQSMQQQSRLFVWLVQNPR